jgi:Protein of unknown function (DUF3341)
MPAIYGCAAEFDDPTKLIEAARRAREVGYRRMEAYSPYSIHELEEIIPMRNPLPAIVLFSGLLGTATAWGMQSGIAIWDFPINVGGRPLYSWPSFVPITFELTVLFAGTAAFFAALWLCGFPRIHHPVFNVAEFARVTDDRFFLCIEARDGRFHPEETFEFLSELEPMRVWEVERE